MEIYYTNYGKIKKYLFTIDEGSKRNNLAISIEIKGKKTISVSLYDIEAFKYIHKLELYEFIFNHKFDDIFNERTEKKIHFRFTLEEYFKIKNYLKELINNV